MNRVFIVAVPEEVNSTTTILGSPVIFSGLGKINASMAVYNAFISGYKEIINIGSCGSLKYPSSEIIKVGQVFQDIDPRPLAEYGYTPGEPLGNQVIIDSKSNNTCFTTDYFYDKNQLSKYSPEYLYMIKNCDIFDMECFALAKICNHFGIKFSSYKWVTDDGDATHWEELCHIGFNKVKEIILDNPKI
jgi:adenosylhomocysteine nucleosidase